LTTENVRKSKPKPIRVEFPSEIPSYLEQIKNGTALASEANDDEGKDLEREKHFKSQFNVTLRPTTLNPIPTKPRRVSSENTKSSLNENKKAEKSSYTSAKASDIYNQETTESEWVSNENIRYLL
jgi:hypothetical protein